MIDWSLVPNWLRVQLPRPSVTRRQLFIHPTSPRQVPGRHCQLPHRALLVLRDRGHPLRVDRHHQGQGNHTQCTFIELSQNQQLYREMHMHKQVYIYIASTRPASLWSSVLRLLTLKSKYILFIYGGIYTPISIYLYLYLYIDHTHIYIHIYSYLYIHTHISRCHYISIFISTYIYVDKHIYLFIYLLIYIYPSYVNI